MAQGALKLNKKKKTPTNKKKTGVLKKGGRAIAPKKSKFIESQKLKKTLQVSINRNIEDDIKARASQSGTHFNIVGTSVKKPKPTPQQGGKKRKNRK